MKSLKSHLNNEDGSGLILALMTLMVLSVLGASLGFITIGGHRLSSLNRDSTSAYYIAEAGVNQAYKEINLIVNEAYGNSKSEDSFYERIDSSIKNRINEDYEITFDDQFNKQPTVSLKVIPINNTVSKNYIIQSVGEVLGQTRTVEKSITVNWVSKDSDLSPNIPDDIGLMANKNIIIDGTQVTGGVYTNAVNNHSIEITHTNINQALFYYNPNFENRDLIKYPNWNKPTTKVYTDSIQWENFEGLINTFPSFPSFEYRNDQKNIRLSNGQGPLTMLIDKDVFFDEIYLDNNENLYIDTQDKDVSIATKHLNLANGHVHIIGNGSVTFHISNKITMSSSSNINKDGDSSNLKIYYSGNNDFTTGGNGTINGSLFSKSSEVKMTFGGSTTITGGIVSAGKEIKLKGRLAGSPFIIAPFANILMENGSFRGVLLGESINITGGSVFTYEKYNMENFPFKSVEGSSEQTNSDIITSEPIVEPQ